MIIHCILLNRIMAFFVLLFTKTRLCLVCLFRVHDVFILTSNNHRTKKLIKISSKLLRSISDLLLILRQQAPPQFCITQTNVLLQISINTMIQQYNFNVSLSIFKYFWPYKQITWMRIAVNEAFYINHLVECLRYDSG